ncbi:MAG: hypothetical protein ACRD0P_14890, partial [Stackebrandtia sp.]
LHASYVVSVYFAWGVVTGIYEYRDAAVHKPTPVIALVSNTFVDCPHCRRNPIRLDDVVCADCEDLGEDTSFMAHVDRNSRMDAVRAIAATHFNH